MRAIALLSLVLLMQLRVLADDKITITGSLADPVISVIVSKQQAAALQGDIQSRAADILTLHMLINNKPADVAVSSRYTLTGNELRLSPMYKLGYNKEFEVRSVANGTVHTRRFTTPASPVSKTISKPTHIYPLADTIPYNTLFFNARFSQQMMDDATAYKYVTVRDEQGMEREQAWRQRSFWLDGGKLLVLMIHPGRVKSGIHYQSPLFDSGRYYTITIAKGIKDINGTPIADSFTKRFYISGIDHTCPKAAIAHTPASNTRTALHLQFTEGMDHASVLNGIAVYDAKGTPVELQITTGKNDARYHLTPTRPWQKGSYTLVLKSAVYDFAANRINRLFEVSDEKELETDKTDIPLPFEIR